MADDLDFLFTDPPPRARIAVPPTRSGVSDGLEWVSLRSAHDRSGIPISTLRKWAKKGRVRAKLERGPERDLRLVAWTDVENRAKQLGRELPDQSDGDDEMQAVVVDLTSGAYPPEQAEEDHEGSVLVPIEAWDRMLIQLGNLHEAGQQLADAKERAARAETEAAFLRERVREYRSQLAKADAPQDPTPAEEPAIINRTALETRFRRWRNRWLR